MNGNRYRPLPHGHRLQGKEQEYVIDRALGQGSFGITYLAMTRVRLSGQLGNIATEAKVAIKEFFMRDLNSREEGSCSLRESTGNSLVTRYRRAFMREAHNLSRMRHAGIVSVLEVLEANNTAYIVMEYIEGSTLDAYIRHRGRLPEVEALGIFRAICDSMCYMHSQRMLHLDMKPKNVMRDAAGGMYVIDFGLSKQYTAQGEPESSTSIGLGTPGYAPIEQGKRQDDGKFHATLDVYALGATLLKMLTGQTPPEASEVSDDVLENPPSGSLLRGMLEKCGVSRKTIAVLLKAMHPSRKQRYQSVPELMGAFGWQAKAYGKDIIVKVATEETCFVDGSTLKLNGHEWVDLGLSVKWATCNVGASSPDDYGWYFAWGETSPKGEYSWETLKYRVSGDSYDNVKFSKYVVTGKYGTVDNRTRLELSDDAARQQWGGGWRMPTEAEFEELVDKCKWSWTTEGGHKGYRVTGPNGRSIFLPAAGYRYGSSLFFVGENGYYWSSSLNTSYSTNAYYLYFYFGNHIVINIHRSSGRSVRPVTE
ncbi:MAG: protein kinase [Bacteroidales bacterium]|nr:protein kinase [Bacteroidales bacterium]